MTRKIRCSLAFTVATVGCGITAQADTIAITEFINDPWGSDGNLEWVEIFNYGADDVNLDGWTLKDNATTEYNFPEVTIPSGGYLVAAKNKSAFEERWLGGTSDDRVLDDRPFLLNNSEDGLYLRNSDGDLVWSLGYKEFDSYRATFLAVDDFSVNNFGIPPQDDLLDESVYINIDGNDGNSQVDLGLGYESNLRTTDPFAFASAAGNETNPEPEWGSPLAGGYTAIPEPASLVLLGAAGVLLAGRRRHHAG